MVSQGSCNQTLGQFHHSSPAGLGLWVRLPLLTCLAVRGGCLGPRLAGRRSLSSATRGLTAAVGTVVPQNKRFELMQF